MTINKTYLLVLLLFAPVHRYALAFSAQLSRPWESPRTSAIVSRRRRWDDSLVLASSVSAQGQDSEGSAASKDDDQDDDEDESMSLQDTSDDSVSHTVLAQPTPLHQQAPSTTNSSTVQQQPTVLSSLRPLWAMCRPSNFYGVVLFHMMGVYLALQSPNVGTAKLLPTLARPGMMVVLLSLLLTTSTSMVVNDYFDNQVGVDAHKGHKALVKGTVTNAVVKRFLYYLYAVSLLSLTMVPGVPARLSVVVGLMLTYLYTKHFKPITWLKNVVCASLIALSPATSGMSAFHATSSISSFRVFQVSSLWRLIGTLFCGFMGREILMDIKDMEDDQLHDIRTVPVKYGRKFASTAALVCTAALAVGSWSGPVWRLWQTLSNTNDHFAALVTSAGSRQLLLASIGSFAMLRRAWHVYKTEGDDRDVISAAVEGGKTSVLFILASFI